jgi:hypothetical protein
VGRQRRDFISLRHIEGLGFCTNPVFRNSKKKPETARKNRKVQEKTGKGKKKPERARKNLGVILHPVNADHQKTP